MSFIRPVDDPNATEGTEQSSATHGSDQTSASTAIPIAPTKVGQNEPPKILPKDLEDIDLDDGEEVLSYAKLFKIVTKKNAPGIETDEILDPVKMFAGADCSVNDLDPMDITVLMSKWEEEEEAKKLAFFAEEEEKKNKQLATDGAGKSGSK